ncbi:hypothetical protein ACNKHU_02970 [Shigella flexneri]
MRLLKRGGAIISLLIITLSFIPIFTLKGRRASVRPVGVHQNVCDGRCGAAGDGSDPDPDGYRIRGKIPPESSNPLNRFLIVFIIRCC